MRERGGVRERDSDKKRWREREKNKKGAQHGTEITETLSMSSISCRTLKSTHKFK